MEDHFKGLKDLHNLDVEFQFGGQPTLTEEQELQVFRIVQESLNNVIKHAKTDKALVILKCDDKRCRITIEDNGEGFDRQNRKTESESFGLSGMKERVDTMQGKLTVDSAPGKGTRINVEIMNHKGVLEDV